MAIGSLTDLQLAVMKAVWRLGEGTASEVLAELADEGKELAPTTVATLLQRLSKQGWVKGRKQGRQLVYSAKIREQEAAQSMVKRLLRSFFGGNPTRLTAHLLESHDLSSAELKELRKLIDGKGH